MLFTSAKLINPYCSALEEFFNELSYYGILKVEDAQCYRSDIGLEPTFYILLAAAAVLAFITSFVSKAVTHYLRDMDLQLNSSLNSNATNDVESASDFSDDKRLEDASTIQPTPVLFTDRYRWLLRRETEMKSNENEENIPISSSKSHGSILLQNTSSTVSTPGSFTQLESERPFLETVADSDDSDMYVNGSPNVGDGRNVSQQSNFQAPPVGPILGAGIGGAMVRRGYDVDEDEWILESVPSGGTGTEAVSTSAQNVTTTYITS